MRKYLALFLSLFLLSCGTREVINNLPSGAEVKYSVVYMINGDGDYLYHDRKGKSHYADEDKLHEALAVAEKCRYGEVFIFHLNVRSSFLFFHHDDGDFYYFRNGSLITKTSYSRSGSSEIFAAESDLYNNFKVKNNKVKTYFLYFGHEIPEIGGKGYFDSYPDKLFNVDAFSKAVGRFASEKKFNLIVLSTCHNGTPGTISKLSPYADFLIASPEDLHLSYIDTRYFESLDTLNQTDFKFAENLADTAFKNLEKRTETVITIALYNINAVQRFLKDVDGKYESLVSRLQQKNISEIEYIDLNDEPGLFPGNPSEGVKVFYRPPKFGINKDKKSHSGWEILEDREQISSG
jgi:hypothetical protein